MSRRTTLSIALVPSAVALVAAFFGISEVIQTIKFIQAHPNLEPPAPPSSFTITGIGGFAALVLVVKDQWRERRTGWIVASILLSHPAIITYCLTQLFGSRPRLTTAQA